MKIGEPSLNRERRNGAGSTDGVRPVASSAASRPAAGPMPNPWPENPVATVKPGIALDVADVGHDIRRDIDVAGPFLHDCDIAKLRV